MKKYVSKILKEETNKFKNYSEFLKWARAYKGRTTDKIKIEIDNITYNSIIDVLESFEE